jgi:Repeat of unknown function (DUF5648)
MKKLITLTLLLFSSYYCFSQQTLLRYYNGKQRKHFYTVDFNEYGNGKNGWLLEGPACTVYTAEDHGRSIVPLFRYFNRQTGDHYYTLRYEEYGKGGGGYYPEGVACYINMYQAPGSVPLLKYFNPSTGDHFYTIDRHELGRHGFEGYQFKGVEGFVYPAPPQQ